MLDEVYHVLSFCCSTCIRVIHQAAEYYRDVLVNVALSLHEKKRRVNRAVDPASLVICDYCPLSEAVVTMRPTPDKQKIHVLYQSHIIRLQASPTDNIHSSHLHTHLHIPPEKRVPNRQALHSHLTRPPPHILSAQPRMPRIHALGTNKHRVR
jgi:hypothetical protein